MERVMPLMDDRDTDQQQIGGVNLAMQRSSPDPGKRQRSPCFDPEMRDQDEHEWAQYEEARKEYLNRPQTGVPQQLMDSPVDDTDHESSYSQIVEQSPLIRPFQAKHWSDFSDTSSDESAREEGPLMKDQKEEKLCESSCSESGFIPSELWGEEQAGSPAAALEHGSFQP
jgi:hypothetical protein